MITEKDIHHIAQLARIHLKTEEMTTLKKDLEKILGYVHQLSDLNISAVEPTSHVLALHNVFREDKVSHSLKQEDALKMAVEKHNGSFKVPMVIEWT